MRLYESFLDEINLPVNQLLVDFVNTRKECVDVFVDGRVAGEVLVIPEPLVNQQSIDSVSGVSNHLGRLYYKEVLSTSWISEWARRDDIKVTGFITNVNGKSAEYSFGLTFASWGYKEGDDVVVNLVDCSELSVMVTEEEVFWTEMLVVGKGSNVITINKK